MKIREINKLIENAKEQGFFQISWLDKSLEENSVFDKNVSHLLRSLGDLQIRNDNKEEDKKAPAKKSGNNSLYGYHQEMSEHTRMTREEERRFSKRMEFFKARLFNAVKESDLTDEEKEVLLRDTGCTSQLFQADAKPFCKDLDYCPSGKEGVIKESCSSYNTVRSDFIERNIHLVVKLAQQYRTYGIPMMDLVQEGNTALIRAVEKYDWRKDVRFQTYASFWLRQAIERFITANRCIVRLPNYLQQKMRRFKREGRISSEKSDLTAGDISEAFSLSHKVAGRLLETDRGHVSLDAPSSNNAGACLAESLAVEEDEFIPEWEREKLKQRLGKAMTSLTRQEKFILDHRFGLEGKKVKTLEELGKFMNVSRERIRQLQIRAIEKLKKPSFSQQLAPFLS